MDPRTSHTTVSDQVKIVSKGEIYTENKKPFIYRSFMVNEEADLEAVRFDPYPSEAITVRVH
jgi:hypothetical protein